MSGGEIKVVRIIARLNIGGPAIHVVNLNAYLGPQNYASKLVSGIENPGEGSLASYALAHGVQPVVIPELVAEPSLKVRDLKALIALYDLIKREAPHIVHTHTAKSGFLGRLAAHAARVPVVVHTYHGHVMSGYYGPLKNRLLRLMERALSRVSDQLIAVSPAIREDLVRFKVAPREKISVVPLGFNLEPFLTCEESRGRFRAELGMDSQDKLVGIIGRIFPVKNHQLFLEVAARVNRKNKQVRFVVVGDGVLRPQMEALSEELGIRTKVIFTGWRNDLPAIYSDLNLLVVSSKNEGTPVSAIEAMASGCPVVATRVGGLPDLIRDGETGYLVPPGDPDALVQRILDVIENPERASELGQQGRKLAREKFSLERLLSDIDGLYRSLLARKGMSL